MTNTERTRLHRQKKREIEDAGWSVNSIFSLSLSKIFTFTNWSRNFSAPITDTERTNLYKERKKAAQAIIKGSVQPQYKYYISKYLYLLIGLSITSMIDTHHQESITSRKNSHF